ncbi:hypothetical protein [Micromonospora sp. NBC_01796]|uniref:hypothetical protein n=1 Tax=Micromonospora sp. NBC_01796 TaxID=2975987 RepID=UPI002DDA9F4C|nr:hypothetical protein [Micromonospora sp. NBC_01796]WSA86811.1 hypothetical protein OIE47_04080 [Micromonospora sp. NBC_01796]
MDVAGDGELIAASLADRLAALTFVDRTPEQVTALLVEEVAAWATGRGWRVYRRAASVLPLPPPYQHRHSFLDVACARPDGPPVAVEIDKTDRRRSVEKLLAEAGAGRIPIWLRWGSRGFETPPLPVRLVTCPVTSRRGPDPKVRLYSRLPVSDRPAPAHATTDLRVDEQTDLFAGPTAPSRAGDEG